MRGIKAENALRISGFLFTKIRNILFNGAVDRKISNILQMGARFDFKRVSYFFLSKVKMSVGSKVSFYGYFQSYIRSS